MPAESTYSVLKKVLAARLSARAGLAGVNVLLQVPTKTDEIRTPTGAFEVIAMAEADGTFDDVVFCDGGLRFDESLLLTILIEVHGVDSDDTQDKIDARTNELLYELLAEVSTQASWVPSTVELDVFDYVFFTPATQQWAPGRLQSTSVYATAMELGLQVSARRSFV
jgi:hypothetical protein